jgi:ketosteroid isomerase-like protein
VRGSPDRLTARLDERDTVVRVLGETAVLTHRVRTTVVTTAGEAVLSERETTAFARQGHGRWLAVHEHLSPAPGA